jgi:hypothetical protein
MNILDPTTQHKLSRHSQALSQANLKPVNSAEYQKRGRKKTIHFWSFRVMVTMFLTYRIFYPSYPNRARTPTKKPKSKKKRTD